MSADDGMPSSQQVDQILGSSRLVSAIENDRYKHILDHVPVAVAISRGSCDQQHIVYVNKAFEILMSLPSADVEGQSWTGPRWFSQRTELDHDAGRGDQRWRGLYRRFSPGRTARSSRHRSSLRFGDRERRWCREFPDRGAGRYWRPGTGADRAIRESDPRSRHC